MKVCRTPMVVMSLLGFGLLASVDPPSARADFTFGEPVNITSTLPPLNQSSEWMNGFREAGLELYVGSQRPGGYGLSDIWVYKRASAEEDWRVPENLGPLVNSAQWDLAPFISADGLELYFHSSRPGGYGGVTDLYVTRRTTRTSPWDPAANLGPKVNGPYDEAMPTLSPDGLELYFTLFNAPGGYGREDLYVSKRATTNDPWGDAVNLGPAVNTPCMDCMAYLSPDGLLLFYSADRPGACGAAWDGYVARRASRSAPWQSAVSLGPTVNSAIGNAPFGVTADGSALYLSRTSEDYSNVTLWKVPILPVVDFNGDGKVDLADMTLFEANLGKNNLSYDIGPYAWGDGMVDEKDLAVLMQSLMTPAARASGIRPDVVLSWMTPSFAEAFDVYLGTSHDAVTRAERTDPCGVLVSEGQMGTTYDPNGLLEYGQTYYWRVDVVTSGPAPTIYKGLVASFTTRPYAIPIKNITATASSSLSSSMGPQKTVDGSGLDALDQHGTSTTTMWVSRKGQSPVWIQYEFDAVYRLHQMWVWNSNQALESSVGYGAKDVLIETSLDAATWTTLAGVPQFAQATGQPDYVHNTTVNFAGVQAKFVRLTINSNWAGTAALASLSEVRFFYVLDDAVAKP